MVLKLQEGTAERACFNEALATSTSRILDRWVVATIRKASVHVMRPQLAFQGSQSTRYSFRGFPRSFMIGQHYFLRRFCCLLANSSPHPKNQFKVSAILQILAVDAADEVVSTARSFSISQVDLVYWVPPFRMFPDFTVGSNLKTFPCCP